MIHDHDFEEEELTERQSLALRIIAGLIVFGLTVLAKILFGS